MTTQAHPIDPARRRILLCALLGMAAGGTLGGCAAMIRSVAERDPCTAPVAALIGDADGMARFGEAYLQDHPAERDIDVLWEALCTVLEGPGGEFLDAADAASAFARLDRAVREEYRRGEVVPVAGWLISRSEARLYAVAALIQQR